MNKVLIAMVAVLICFLIVELVARFAPWSLV